MNLRPSGYEPDELPDCSTPRYVALFFEGLIIIPRVPFIVKHFYGWAQTNRPSPFLLPFFCCRGRGALPNCWPVCRGALAPFCCPGMRPAGQQKRGSQLKKLAICKCPPTSRRLQHGWAKSAFYKSAQHATAPPHRQAQSLTGFRFFCPASPLSAFLLAAAPAGAL